MTTDTELCCPGCRRSRSGSARLRSSRAASPRSPTPSGCGCSACSRRAPDGAVCACDLVVPVGKSQPTVSHHLGVLREAGLVTREKRGTNVWYAVVPDALERLREALAGR